MTSRIAVALASLTCAVALAACGDDDKDTIASAEYIKQCEEQIGASQTGVLDDQQVEDICKCTQDRLVEQGHGDKGLDDESLKDEGEKVGRDCALEVIGQQ
jgi:hypothetical protein